MLGEATGADRRTANCDEAFCCGSRKKIRLKNRAVAFRFVYHAFRFDRIRTAEACWQS